MNIIRQAILTTASRLKDKSVKISFTTSLEQTSEQFMEIDKMLDQHGIVYFKSDGDLTQEEVDKLDAVDIEIEGKTKSQRLRNVLYVYYSQLNLPLDFKEFYSSEMEKLIESYKAKLD